MLEKINCTIDIASNGNEALKMFKDTTYDLIFMDVGLPDMDGLQVTREIRRLEKDKQHLPIIALTAHVLEEDRINCINAGADDVLEKPVIQTKLYEVLNKWIVNLNGNNVN